MGKFLVGLIVGLIVIPVCVYMYFSSGTRAGSDFVGAHAI